MEVSKRVAFTPEKGTGNDDDGDDNDDDDDDDDDDDTGRVVPFLAKASDTWVEKRSRGWLT